MNGKPKAKPKKITKKDGRVSNGGAREGCGAPRVEIDYAQLEDAANNLCTMDEIAGWIGISRSALYDILERDPRAREIYDCASSKGRAMLRMAQMRTALDGNPTMLIFLGKNYLGQSNENVLRVNTDSLTKTEKAVLPDWLKQAVQVQKRSQVIDVTVTDGSTNHSQANEDSMPTSGQNTRDTADQSGQANRGLSVTKRSS